MPLGPGTRLGPYEIVSALGAGGMGEVYKARDTRLDRTVAIKVMPSHISGDPTFRERFEREARTVAALSHPHICTLHDVGHQDGVEFLVLEYLEGETLAQRLMKGALPLDQALALAIQIADALDKAHRAGIVHRDLKPGNIMLTKSGAKLLDFGLAKVTASNIVASGISVMPTQAPLTAQGTILGTLQYMAPEQLEGQEVDVRTDIFAFGAVLYEMLTGKKAFEGKSQASLIAAILEREPSPLMPIQPLTPPGLDRVVRKCLAKGPDNRWQTAFDLLDELRWIATAGSQVVGPAPMVPRRRVRKYVAWGLTTAGLLLAIAVFFLYLRGSRPAAAVARFTTPSEMRVEITTPPTNDLVSLALSPDGEKLAFVASSDHRPRMWLRSLVTGSAAPLPGTDGATFPFWSPDSRSIGFFANGNLYRIDTDGGSLRALAIAPVGAGGSWSRDGEILFTLVPDAPLSRVPAAGGKPQPLPGSQAGRTQTPQPGQRFPQFLPDGRHFLYYVAETPMRGVYLGALDSPERQRLFDADAAAVFVPPARVLFVRASKLYTQRLDPARLQLEGNAVALADGVSVDAFGAAAISGSASGAIVYRVGSANRQRQFTWFDRSGTEVGVAGAADAASPLNPALSPDGRQLALNRSTDGNVDIWLYDLGRRVLSRFTSDPRPDIYPVWSPDGSRIAYATTNRAGIGFNLYQKPVATTSEPVSLFESPDNMLPEDWSRDGRFVSYLILDAAGRWDIGALPTTGGGKPFLVTKTPSNEMSSQFSPDGRWIAYESDESGRNEVYVQSFPGSGAKTIVSTGGGLQPRWRPDGRELFYVAPDGKLMAVAMRVTSDGKALEPASPIALFVTRISSTRTGGSRHEYVVSNDGQRFLMNTFLEQNDRPITLVLNPAPLAK